MKQEVARRLWDMVEETLSWLGCMGMLAFVFLLAFVLKYWDQLQARLAQVLRLH